MNLLVLQWVAFKILGMDRSGVLRILRIDPSITMPSTKTGSQGSEPSIRRQALQFLEEILNEDKVGVRRSRFPDPQHHESLVVGGNVV